MSWVTNIVLNIGLPGDEEHIGEVNLFFEEMDVPGLISINHSLPERWYGGDQVFEANLFIGAFDWLELDNFVRHLISIKWEEPALVQLFVKEQNNATFKIIPIA